VVLSPVEPLPTLVAAAPLVKCRWFIHGLSMPSSSL